jgi:hypothetical protein
MNVEARHGVGNPAETIAEAPLFWTNPQERSAFTDLVISRTITEIGAHRIVTPYSRYCYYTTPEATKELISRGFKAATLEHTIEGRVEHAFTHVEEDKDRPHWIADFQFQQFIGYNDRTEVPPEMLFTYETRADVVAALTAHRIPERYHSLWTTELFAASL